MKTTLIHALLAAGSLASTHATVLAQDTFVVGDGNYTVGSVSGQNPPALGFDGAWNAVINNTVSARTLDMAGGGGSLIAGNGGRSQRLLTSGATVSNSHVGTVYVGFVMQLSGGNNYLALELNNGSGDGNRSIQVGASTTDFGSTTNFGLRVNNNNSFQLASDTAINTDINRFVLALDLSADPNADIVRLFVNPTNTTGEGGNSFTEITGFNFGGFDRIGVANFSAGGITMGIDDVRIATSFGEAIPEPSSAALMLGALGGMVLRRRRA